MRQIPSTVALALLLVAGTAQAAPAAAKTTAAPPPFSPATLARASVVFRGTVRALGAATASLPAEPRSAVVTVDEVLEAAAPELAEIAGQEVTVRLADGSAARSGSSLVWLAQAQAAGASFGLLEVGETAVREPAELRREIAAARAALADGRLAALLAASPLVVSATVQSVEGVRPGPGRSQHDPQWTEAILRVESVGKGTAGSAVVVYFAGSSDGAWATAPRLSAGQSGVFILRDGAALPRFAVKGPVLLTADDVQPRAAIDRIRTLLRGGAGK